MAIVKLGLTTRVCWSVKHSEIVMETYFGSVGRYPAGKLDQHAHQARQLIPTVEQQGLWKHPTSPPALTPHLFMFHLDSGTLIFQMKCKCRIYFHHKREHWINLSLVLVRRFWYFL